MAIILAIRMVQVNQGTSFYETVQVIKLPVYSIQYTLTQSLDREEQH